jgi:hypothetical protein
MDPGYRGQRNKDAFTALILSACPNQEIEWPFLFTGIIIGTSPYFGVDSAT